MRQQSRESIVILFISAALAINYPILHLFDRAWALFGIPLLYLYLYLIWLVIIVLLIVVVEHSAIPQPLEPSQPAPVPAADSATAPETLAKSSAADLKIIHPDSMELP